MRRTRDFGPTVVIVDRVSKVYRGNLRQRSVAHELVYWLLRRRRTESAHWALRDVSFSLRRSESLGIVGGNGAGKSTLLKIIAGIAVPSSGTVKVRAKISTQLALGAGFHPYMSGLENVFLHGTVLGLTNSRIREILPGIVEFAGFEEAMDRPLWTYSNGMIARLGFAVAAHTESELLLLDEALSAGDLTFQKRCAERLHELRAAGTTLLIVSHQPQDILELCDRAIWLENGMVREDGSVEEVVNNYTLARSENRPAAPRSEDDPSSKRSATL